LNYQTKDMNYAKFKHLQEFQKTENWEGWTGRTWAQMAMDRSCRSPAMGREGLMGWGPTVRRIWATKRVHLILQKWGFELRTWEKDAKEPTGWSMDRIWVQQDA
jgi:hypothetical protein